MSNWYRNNEYTYRGVRFKYARPLEKMLTLNQEVFKELDHFYSVAREFLKIVENDFTKSALNQGVGYLRLNGMMTRHD